LHVRADLLSIAQGTRARLSDGARLHLALGHRLVLVLQECRRAESGAAPPVRAPAARLAHLSTADALERALGRDQSVESMAGRLHRIGDPGRRYPDPSCPGVSTFFRA